jgi:hypothetical protein
MKIYKSKNYFKNTKKSKHNKKGGSESSQKCLYNETSQIMEGVCPGVIYFNEIKDSIVIDPNAVYTVIGHACDILDDIQDIPAGCQYITAVACGLSKFSDKGHENDLWKDFLNNSLNRSINEQSLIKYKKFSDNKGKLPRESPYVRDQQYRIQREGDKFVNSRNWCFLEFSELAGLRKLGYVTPSIPELTEDLPQIYTMRSYFLMHFEGSLYPTCSQVNELLKINFSDDELNNYNYYFNYDTMFRLEHNTSSEDPLTEDDDDFLNLKYANIFRNIIKEHFLIDLSTLMLNLKGTFINNSCRTLCGKFGTTQYDITGDNESVRQSRITENR